MHPSRAATSADHFLLAQSYEIIQHIVESCGGKAQFLPENRHQTEKGIVIEEYAGMPILIHTPLGTLRILSSGVAPASKIYHVIEGLKETLGLELLQEAVVSDHGTYGPFWAVKTWKKISFEDPEFRIGKIPEQELKLIWDKFLEC